MPTHIEFNAKDALFIEEVFSRMDLDVMCREGETAAAGGDRVRQAEAILARLVKFRKGAR